MSSEYPLTRNNRLQIARAFHAVPRVDLSIECVIEGQMGKAFVDRPEHPQAFRVQTGPFVYLAGQAHSPGGRALLEELLPYTLIMPSAPGWLEAARELYVAQLLEIDRYSFAADSLSASHLEGLCAASHFSDQILRMDARFAESVWEKDHFVDLSAYDSPQDFARRGIGYTLSAGTDVRGAAYASLVCSRGIEISLFVRERDRRRGIATMLSARLLLWCLQNGLEPHWDAANPESARLAVKLGYRALGSYPVHYFTGPCTG